MDWWSYMPKIKCRQCGKQIDKSEAIEFKPKFHVCSEECKNQWVYDHSPKPKTTTISDSKRLTDYVYTYAPQTDWIVFNANVKRLCKEYNMTISGIQYTLWYINNKTDTDMYDSGLGLVPYYYSVAKSYFQWQQKMKRQLSNWQQNDEDVVICRKNAEKDVFD